MPTPYKAISAPVILEMMYGSWNGKTFVLGNYICVKGECRQESEEEREQDDCC
jgi:hypothetical protein